jgi:hypothetical protein
VCRVLHVLLGVGAMWLSSCAPTIRVTAPPSTTAPVSLWEEPTDLASRDLYYGPWGPERAPDPKDVYVLVEYKHDGVNPGMTVRDSRGRRWSVKQAPADGTASEGPIEVIVSRVLSAIGYHQPPVYYLASFTFKDDWGVRTEPGGRFRLKDPRMKDRGGWSWQQNPFVGSRPYHGLLVVLMMFRSSDLKNSNNTLYEYRSGDSTELRYVVRDLGTALGDTSRFDPQRGDPRVFERQRVFNGIRNGFVDFHFHGWHQQIVRQRITPADVGWATDLLSRLTAEQWSDAFRAGGYADETAARFTRKLRADIAEGRTLARPEAHVGGGG